MLNIFLKFFTNSEEEEKEDEEKGYNKNVEEQGPKELQEELRKGQLVVYRELQEEEYINVEQEKLRKEEEQDEQIRIRRIIDYREELLREQRHEEFLKDEKKRIEFLKKEQEHNEIERIEQYSTQQLGNIQKEDNLEESTSLKYKKSIKIDDKNQFISSVEKSPNTYMNRSTTMLPSTTLIRNNFQRITEKPCSTDIYFNNKDFMNSIALDILCIYIKGQKTLYTEAKTYCEQQLNFLMLPAIFISSITSFLSFVFNNKKYGAIVISSLAAFNTFILSLISYLKLDAKSQAHKISAYKYEKLESLCQFNSGKNLFFEDVTKILELISQIEKEVNEIKEINQFILPEYIRYKYAILYSTNIFSIVKKIQLNENKRKTELQNNINKMYYKTQLYDQLLYSENNMENIENSKSQKEIIKLQKEIETLEFKKNEIISDLISSRGEYFELDTSLRNEIDKNIRQKIKKWSLCNWLKS